MKTLFTPAERKLLYGVASKIGAKHGCSSMYVRYLINGQRATNTPLTRLIVQDLEDLLEIFLQPANKPGANLEV